MNSPKPNLMPSEPWPEIPKTNAIRLALSKFNEMGKITVDLTVTSGSAVRILVTPRPNDRGVETIQPSILEWIRSIGEATASNLIGPRNQYSIQKGPGEHSLIRKRVLPGVRTNTGTRRL